MKKLLMFLCAVMLIFGMVGIASATSYTSTFDVAGDFSLTGFSEGTPLPTPTNGPDLFNVSDVTGGFLLDVPPPGTYGWYVDLEILALDLDGDSSPDFSFGPSGSVFVGTYAAPTPELTGTYNFGDVYIPSYYSGLGNYTLNNLSMDWTITIIGTDITEIDLTINADNLDTTLNWDLTYLDNYLGGADGIIDGTATAKFSVTAVPEPSTILLIGTGLLGLAGYNRKRFSKKS